MTQNNLGNMVPKYTSRLDQQISLGTCTADLNMNQDLLGEMSGAGVIEIATIAMDGLADHVRGKGFVRGGAELKWTPYQLEFERDREFVVDKMDDEERLGIMTANLMAQFQEQHVIPEIDAIRFARMAENAGNMSAAAYTDPAEAMDDLLEAEECMQDNGVQLSGCILYCTSAYKTLIRKAQPWRIGQGETPNGKFETIDDMRIRTVPSTRFYTAVDLLDGVTAGEEKGGYKAAEDGKAINFQVVHPSAVAAISRLVKLRYFPPELNQDDDAHKWQYRLFHDMWVYKNKKQLIYGTYAE